MKYYSVIDQIVNLPWNKLSEESLIRVAWAYYYFSIQFRENLLAARDLYPNDANLKQLEDEECSTDNLSPWPGVAVSGEIMNHDEFMRRSLLLTDLESAKKEQLNEIGDTYLKKVRSVEDEVKALSIASYEDGGLEAVFGAILKARFTENLTLQAFKHFLEKHIEFDSDPDGGHGALSRHIKPDDRILPLWQAFYDLFLAVVPELREKNA